MASSGGQGYTTRDVSIANASYGVQPFSCSLSSLCVVPVLNGLVSKTISPMSTVVTGQKAESAGGRVSPTTYLPLFTSVILPSRQAVVIAHNFANLSRINLAEVAN